MCFSSQKSSNDNIILIICVDAVTLFAPLVKTSSRKTTLVYDQNASWMRALQVLLHCKIYSHFRVEFALDFQSPPPQFFQDDPLFCALKNCSHFIFSRPTRIQSHFQISHALDTLKLHHFPCPARKTKKKSSADKLWKSYST